MRSDLDPPNLLREFKRIETDVGRRKTFRNGPRIIDLDIIFYDNLVKHYDTVDSLGDLCIPHKLMFERDFVLAPLCDLIPDYIHPVLNKSMIEMLKEIKNETVRVMQLSPDHIVPIDNRSYLMGILNITPDSFSDGGKYMNEEVYLKLLFRIVEKE